MTTLAASSVQEVSTIESHMIPNDSIVVFDWDNTLKIVNKETKRIESRVNKEFLRHLIGERGCELYVISAIRPSQMNMDTLLMEVDRLGLRNFFCQNSKGREKGANDFPWVREGNIIICGYNKAEVFLTLREKDMSCTDEVDCADDGHLTKRPVVFFDDEAENIEKFSHIVKDSLCYKIEG
ncbi:uncharacterized protein LOC101852236 [Aplysia californica]|uniref:Uncharacterized protein LOC101852236 n=1 Tax=Aplysia californica TaxID=6500 RepID=A0ABM0JM52_APLCA|nr:uncharacterized protein LOC101852236 [Aplysia californica]XP_005096923.1 uncharacterized protein LOC101852236 [Aplysia californica]XP_035825249.1 uncharacterized protein LOC101852236 [Aplysia californica]XP_035825250.1 uncharacterized protein LOC101852236 [Aplysia californica]